MTLLEACEQIGLKPIKKTSTEYATTCPGCGGKDRFLIWPYHESGKEKFYCRQCGKRGDIIDFLREFRNLTYQEAYKEVDRTVISHAEKKTENNNTTIIRHKEESQNKKTFSSARYEKPNEKWLEKAEKFLAYCQSDETLESIESINSLIWARRLPPGSCRQFGIGWNPQDFYDDWGTGKKIRIPKGIVIATRRRIGIVKLLIRTVGNDLPKYWQISGSVPNMPYIPKFEANKPIFIFESELDAALLASEAGDICNTAALGGIAKDIDDASYRYIHAAPLIILSPDNDDAGQAYIQKWRKKFPLAYLNSVKHGKDLTEMHIKAFDEMALAVRNGLPTSSQIPTAGEWAEDTIKRISFLAGKKFYFKTPITNTDTF